jgi:hypothetical protein
MTIDHDFIVEATRAAPTVTVGGLTIVGIPLPEVVLIVTLVYTVAQLYFLLRDKWYVPRQLKKGKHGRD